MAETTLRAMPEARALVIRRLATRLDCIERALVTVGDDDERYRTIVRQWAATKRLFDAAIDAAIGEI